MLSNNIMYKLTKYIDYFTDEYNINNMFYIK